MGTKAKDTGRGYLFKRGARWYLTWRENGKYMTRRLADEAGAAVTTIREAERARDRMLEHLAIGTEKGRVEAILNKHHSLQETARRLDIQRDGARLGNAFEVYEAMPKRREASDQTRAAYRAYWQGFTAWMGANYPNVELVADITKEHAAGYVQTLDAATKSTDKKTIMRPRTFNARVSALRLLCRLVRKHDGLGEPNPFADIELKTDKPLSRDVLPMEKLRDVVAAAPIDIKILMHLGYYTGQRLGDCATARWADFDLDGRTWKLRQHKTGADVELKLVPALLRLLTAVPENERRGALLPELARLHAQNYSELIDRIMRAFRAVLGDEVYHNGEVCLKKDAKRRVRKGSASREGPKFTAKRRVRYGFHSLRHTFNTYLLRAGVSSHVIRAITGHTSESMTARYSHIDVNPQSIGSAMALLPELTPDAIAIEAPPDDARDALLGRLHRLECSASNDAIRNAIAALEGRT